MQHSPVAVVARAGDAELFRRTLRRLFPDRAIDVIGVGGNSAAEHDSFISEELPRLRHGVVVDAVYLERVRDADALALQLAELSRGPVLLVGVGGAPLLLEDAALRTPVERLCVVDIHTQPRYGEGSGVGAGVTRLALPPAVDSCTLNVFLRSLVGRLAAILRPKLVILRLSADVLYSHPNSVTNVDHRSLRYLGRVLRRLEGSLGLRSVAIVTGAGYRNIGVMLMLALLEGLLDKRLEEIPWDVRREFMRHRVLLPQRINPVPGRCSADPAIVRYAEAVLQKVLGEHGLPPKPPPEYERRRGGGGGNRHNKLYWDALTRGASLRRGRRRSNRRLRGLRSLLALLLRRAEDD